MVIRFSGAPARTDHTAQGLGNLVARGVLRSKRNSEDELNMTVQLERTAIPEIARLFDLQDSGVRGYFASNLKLDGPLVADQHFGRFTYRGHSSLGSVAEQRGRLDAELCGQVESARAAS